LKTVWPVILEGVLVATEERDDITGLPPMYCVSHGNDGILFTEEPDIQEQFVLNDVNVENLVTYFLAQLNSLHSQKNQKVPEIVRQQFIAAVKRFVNDTLKEIADDDKEWMFAESLGVDMHQYNGPWDSVYCPRQEEEEIPMEEQGEEIPKEEQGEDHGEEIPIDEP
jgi:hypothetical protein